MKLLSSITLHEGRLGAHNAYFMTHVETIDFLVVTFFFEGSFGFGFIFRFPFFYFKLTFFFGLGCSPFLFCFKPTQSHWDFIRQNEYPKTTFLHFLKYRENKESHLFTIDNTNILKKRSQFFHFYHFPRLERP